jgi:Na+-transporting methylmalonyl-CoA/oxaloacetate decarboxylase beta subunit
VKTLPFKKYALFSGFVSFGIALILEIALFAQNKISKEATSIGIIGGADGPTAIYLTEPLNDFDPSIFLWFFKYGKYIFVLAVCLLCFLINLLLYKLLRR